MAEVTHREVARDEAGMRLDRWFKEHLPGLGFGHLQKLLRSGQIRIDGGRAKADTRLEAGQVVRIPPVTLEPRSDVPVRSADAQFMVNLILHEDEHLYVFNKPHGLAVQGGSGTTRHVDGLLEALRDRQGRKPRLVHRLDKDTSGVLVVAKTKAAASALAASFRGRTTQKVYWAIVRGVPKPRQGRISTYLARVGARGEERMEVARHGDDDADHALTYYNVIETSGQKVSWVTLKPVTGRTHQLRAHANHIGHPIIGDPKYFDVENWELPGGIQKKLHLHARRLVIPHPKGGTLDVTAPLPPHMVQTFNLLGLDAESLDEEGAA